MNLVSLLLLLRAAFRLRMNAGVSMRCIIRLWRVVVMLLRRLVLMARRSGFYLWRLTLMIVVWWIRLVGLLWRLLGWTMRSALVASWLWVGSLESTSGLNRFVRALMVGWLGRTRLCGCNVMPVVGLCIGRLGRAILASCMRCGKTRCVVRRRLVWLRSMCLLARYLLGRTVCLRRLTLFRVNHRVVWSVNRRILCGGRRCILTTRIRIRRVRGSRRMVVGTCVVRRSAIRASMGWLRGGTPWSSFRVMWMVWRLGLLFRLLMLWR